MTDDGRVQFKHLSFQEYLTAHAHFRRDDLAEPFVEAFNDPWWQDVAVFYGGLRRDAPGLLRRVLEDARPTSIREFILGVGGLGRLLQAIYGTDAALRAEAVQAALNYASSAIRDIEQSSDPQHRELQSFSSFAWITVLRWFFTQAFRSLTLVEPMERTMRALVERMAELALADEDGSASEPSTVEAVFDAEFQMLLLASTLADQAIGRVDGLRDLSLYTSSNRIELLAAESAFVEHEINHLLRDPRRDVQKTARKVRRKLLGRLQQIGDVADLVNRPIRSSLPPKQDRP